MNKIRVTEYLTDFKSLVVVFGVGWMVGCSPSIVNRLREWSKSRITGAEDTLLLTYNNTSLDAKLGPGYAKPSNINVQFYDLNENGFYETVLNYKDKQYLMKEDPVSHGLLLVPYKKIKTIELREEK